MPFTANQLRNVTNEQFEIAETHGDNVARGIPCTCQTAHPDASCAHCDTWSDAYDQMLSTLTGK